MKKFISLILIVSLIFTLVACENSEENNKAELNEVELSEDNKLSTDSSKNIKNYSIGSGSVGGNFYLMGGGIATTINKHLPKDFLFTSETTGGGTSNIIMLEENDAELGIAMSSSLAEAFEGTAEWTTGIVHDKIRAALALYPSWLTIYTSADSGIETLEDLQDKIVGLGGKGMAMDTTFRQFFKDKGIEPKQIHNDGHSATASALKDGVIDAAILFSYPPFASISELESTMDLKFIELTDEEQDYFVENYSHLVASDMPSGFYKGTSSDVKSVSEWNMLITSTNVPDEDVYLIVKTLCENQEDMIAVHPSAKYMTAENILNSNIYLHSGTIKYLKELGIEVPEDLIPPEYNN